MCYCGNTVFVGRTLKLKLQCALNLAKHVKSHQRSQEAKIQAGAYPASFKKMERTLSVTSDEVSEAGKGLTLRHVCFLNTASV